MRVRALLDAARTARAGARRRVTSATLQARSAWGRGAGRSLNTNLVTWPLPQAVQQRFSEEQAARHAEAETRRAAHRRRRRRRFHPQSFLLLRLVGEQHRRGQPEQLDQARRRPDK